MTAGSWLSVDGSRTFVLLIIYNGVSILPGARKPRATGSSPGIPSSFGAVAAPLRSSSKKGTPEARAYQDLQRG